ncbi:hypothetical protein [Mangrovibacterium sp.]|uniref:hypothetical protein n=1 Tax=Mangrovibacterium sp. TaxID=1961364 RepID=UPI003561D748
MKSEFTPMLIGKDEERIKTELNRWDELIEALNHLSSEWQKRFKSPIELKDLSTLAATRDLLRFFQVLHIEQDERYSDFMNSLSVKIDKLIEMVELPDFTNIIMAVQAFQETTIHLPGWQNQFKSIFNGESFEATSELVSQIVDSNSHYTRNEQENTVLILIQKFCATINSLNNIGCNFCKEDFPASFSQLMIPYRTERKYSDLPKSTGNPNYFITNYKPAYCMFRNSNSGVVSMISYLSDEQSKVLQLKF